jgi:hypothetical protein
MDPKELPFIQTMKNSLRFCKDVLSSLRTGFKELPFVRTMRNNLQFYKHVQSSLRWYHDDRDPKRLLETAPPDSEKIEIHCTWVTEAFTPSNISHLIESLRTLGWDTPSGGVESDPSLSEWILQGRSHGGGSSWCDGGFIFPPEKAGSLFPGRKRIAALPSGVDYGRLFVHNITSSLTLVTIQFVFDDNTAQCLNKPLRSLYRTKAKYRWRGVKLCVASFNDPIHPKGQAVDNERNAIHARIYLWFRENLPGHYSSLKPLTLPTVDLITSLEYQRPDENEYTYKHDYLGMLFGPAAEFWRSKGGNLELVISSRKDKHASILFGNYNDLIDGDKSRGALINLVDDLDTSLGVWAAHDLLSNFELQLCGIRDRATSPISGTRRALKNLDYIRHRFVSISTDVQVICDDLVRRVQSVSSYSDGEVDFDPPSRMKAYCPSFQELMRQQDQMRIKRLEKLESRVNNAIISSGNLASAVTNLRLQRNMNWLTVIMAVLALFSIFRDQIMKYVMSVLNH